MPLRSVCVRPYLRADLSDREASNCTVCTISGPCVERRMKQAHDSDGKVGWEWLGGCGQIYFPFQGNYQDKSENQRKLMKKKGNHLNSDFCFVFVGLGGPGGGFGAQATTATKARQPSPGRAKPPPGPSKPTKTKENKQKARSNV